MRCGWGDSLEAAVRFANAAGALTTTKVGAQSAMPFLSDLEEFMETHAD
jgi:sugar/nucleoside kinase (ribokinase family)